MLAGFQGWSLLASYFPQRSAKARFFATCKEVAASHARTPLVIVGDLNTGNQTTDRSAGGRFFVLRRLRCAAIRVVASSPMAPDKWTGRPRGHVAVKEKRLSD